MVFSLPPECEQLLIVGYVLGNLSPAEAMLFEELVAENPELMQQVEEVQQTLEMTFPAREVAPSPELRERLLTAHAAQESSSQPQPTIVSTSNSRFSWSNLIFAIATGLILVLGFNNYRLWNSLKNAAVNQTETLQTNKIVYFLRGAEPASVDSTARLAIYPNRTAALLEVNDLPPLPPGKVYTLWTVVGHDAPYTTDTKGAILTQVFQVNSQGQYSGEISIPQPYQTSPDLVRKVAITIESQSAPQAHTGSILIYADFPELS